MDRGRVYLRNGAEQSNGTFEQSNEALFAAMESLYDGIFITDGQANTIYVNQSYLIISGLRKEDVMNRNVIDLVKQGLISKSGSLLALEEKKTVTLTQVFKTQKQVFITSTPIFDSNEDIVMVVTNVRDISELNRLQQELKETSEISRQYHSTLELMRKQVLREGDFLAVDEKMIELLTLVTRVSALDTPVMLLGETGVGKERIASYIYKNSARRNEKFIKVNCAAISESIIESELFGYEPGAFTGASKQGKLGFFGIADKGTIFLDEIGDLPLNVQVKLLRVLQEQEIVPVGGALPQKVDIRILAATNRNLEQMVEQGLFRKDLYYRLNVFPITVPPLRERVADIAPMARSTLEMLNRKYAKEVTITSGALLEMERYHWPGNVRELKNVVERAFIMCGGQMITAADLPLYSPRCKQGELPHMNQGMDLRMLLELKELEYMELAYREYKTVRDAAKSLSIPPSTFSRRRKYLQEQYGSNNETVSLLE